eukprot:jgi/Orpsp1_1/1177468/evm.model.c7180000061548.2
MNIINEIENENKNKINIPLTSVNYQKELTIDRKTEKIKSKEKYIGGFGGKRNENEDILELNIYYNLDYQLSLPMGINIIDNAILRYQNINREIIVTYYPLSKMAEIEKIEVEDREHWINVLSEGYIKIVNLSFIYFISVTLSYTISCFGPLIVKDKETNLVTQLYSHGLKPKYYWMGVLLSDSFYILIPMMTISYMTNTYLPEIDLFNEKLIGLTVSISILCI